MSCLAKSLKSNITIEYEKIPECLRIFSLEKQKNLFTEHEAWFDARIYKQKIGAILAWRQSKTPPKKL